MPTRKFKVTYAICSIEQHWTDFRIDKDLEE